MLEEDTSFESVLSILENVCKGPPSLFFHDLAIDIKIVCSIKKVPAEYRRPLLPL